CEQMKKWCCFRCTRCEEKKEKRESFRPCDKCAMTIIDSSENYTFLIEKKLYLQYSNNRKIEITSDFVQGINESYNIFNPNQQSIISASTPVYSVEDVSLPSPQQYVPPTHVTTPNYDFSSVSPFDSFTENSF
ncbi:3571_t:CDS:2, partial [Gigaspora margarita]